MSAPSHHHGRGGGAGAARSSLEIAAADDLAPPPPVPPPPPPPGDVEERYRAEREQAKLRHWKESEYAAGLVEPPWSDEMEQRRRGEGGCGCGQMCQEEVDPGCGCVYLSAVSTGGRA